MYQKEVSITNNDLNNLTMSQLVKKNFKAAAVFEKYNLDFCCRGNRPVAAACQDAGVDASSVITELESINAADIEVPFGPDEWSLDFLIDYIINTHHSYVRKMIPVISAHAEKVALVHGKNHPEAKEIARIFAVVYKDLKQHMVKEEEILFPYVKRLVRVQEGLIKFEAPYFGSVNNPIRMMEIEHQNAGDELYEIRRLSSSYTPPADACNTYQVLYKELKDFEEDLHKHVHLENNILFPKGIQLEEDLKK